MATESRADLYQAGARVYDESIKEPVALVSIVNQFFDYKAPHIQEWEAAVANFSDRIPELAAAVKKTIDEEKKRNPSFVRSFEDFYALCRQAINPNSQGKVSLCDDLGDTESNQTQVSL